ncbi:MAG: DUF3253 domain-containing protein [Sphingobacteriales bacterium]|nr:MAG: DUF3253 domain-containing protein [Sphingobacteriales bacterium]
MFVVMPSEISKTILDVACKRGPDKSTCPSEIARMLFGDEWRREMGQVREIAIDLHREGKVVITQKGLPVDVDHIKGPVRIKINRNDFV